MSRENDVAVFSGTGFSIQFSGAFPGAFSGSILPAAALLSEQGVYLGELN